jgi:ectoine hydroxylase-related dioxygenase (phytanoyl-CoA dioxygenase family)
MPVTAHEKQALDETGYLVLEDFMSADLLSSLQRRVQQVFAEEGDRAGSEFKQEPGARRLANLVDKGEIFQDRAIEPRILDLVQHVLGPEFKLSSMNVRRAEPHNDCPQPLHADMGAIADERGYWVCNTVWMLDDFTTENGAIRFVPGSHRWRKLPQDVLSDLAAPHPGEVLLTGKAGTVVVMNAHIWHGATANRTGRTRTALHVFYCRRDKPQQQYQKQLVRPEVQQRFSSKLREVLALDDPLNDELSTATIPRSGFMK